MYISQAIFKFNELAPSEASFRKFSSKIIEKGKCPESLQFQNEENVLVLAL